MTAKTVSAGHVSKQTICMKTFEVLIRNITVSDFQKTQSRISAFFSSFVFRVTGVVRLPGLDFLEPLELLELVVVR